MSAAHAPTSAASPASPAGSPVVDMDRWRAGSRVLRTPVPAASAAAAAGGAGDRPPAATVLPLPVAARREPRPGQPGPMSVFGPVMAFGLRRRTGTGADDVPAAGPLGEPAAGVPALPAACSDGSAPAVTSWARGSRSRRLPDARGASRGPRR